MLARVLGKCPVLAHLNLCYTRSGSGLVRALAEPGVLGGCKALIILELSCNAIGDGGAEMLAGVLGECKTLTNLQFKL